MEKLDYAYGVVPVRYVDGRAEFLLTYSKRYRVHGLPKGHPNPGETHIQTAIRELLEETGHEPTLFWSSQGWTENPEEAFQVELLQYSFAHKGVIIRKSVGFYIAQVKHVTDTIDTEEVDSIAWYPATLESAQLIHYPGSIQHFLTHIMPRITQLNHL